MNTYIQDYKKETKEVSSYNTVGAVKQPKYSLNNGTVKYTLKSEKLPDYLPILDYKPNNIEENISRQKESKIETIVTEKYQPSEKKQEEITFNQQEKIKLSIKPSNEEKVPVKTLEQATDTPTIPKETTSKPQIIPKTTPTPIKPQIIPKTNGFKQEKRIEKLEKEVKHLKLRIDPIHIQEQKRLMESKLGTPIQESRPLLKKEDYSEFVGRKKEEKKSEIVKELYKKEPIIDNSKGSPELESIKGKKDLYTENINKSKPIKEIKVPPRLTQPTYPNLVKPKIKNKRILIIACIFITIAIIGLILVYIFMGGT